MGKNLLVQFGVTLVSKAVKDEAFMFEYIRRKDGTEPTCFSCCPVHHSASAVKPFT